MRTKDGAMYAFRVVEIVSRGAWHWVLLPVDSTAAVVAEVFDKAAREPPASWLSLLEDARGDTRRVTLVAMVSSVHPIPRDVFRNADGAASRRTGPA